MTYELQSFSLPCVHHSDGSGVIEVSTNDLFLWASDLLALATDIAQHGDFSKAMIAYDAGPDSVEAAMVFSDRDLALIYKLRKQ